MVLVLIIATGPTNAKTRQDVYNVLENRLSLVGIKPSCFQKLHQSVCMPAEQMAGKRESMLSVSKDKAHGREEAESTSAKNTIQARRILAMRSTRCPPATSASYLISLVQLAAMVSSLAQPQSKSNLSHAEPGRARPSSPPPGEQSGSRLPAKERLQSQIRARHR